MTISKASIINALMTNPRAVEKALVMLYREQTADEQASRQTWHTNGRGFAYRHAKEGSRLARLILAGLPLIGEEKNIGREIALYYAGTQLLAAAKVKAAAKQDAAKQAAQILMLDPFQSRPMGIGFLR